MNLRRKILTGFVGAFLLFVLAMYPLASQIVHRLITKAIVDRASELIQKMDGATDDEALVQKLKDQKYLIFFRVALITDDRRLLYDSYLKRLIGPGFNDKPALNHPEVEQAFRDGIGFHEGYSKLLNQRFVYMAKAFDFNGKTYVLRTAFPYKFVADLTYDAKIGVLGLSIFAMLLFGLMMWVVTNRVTRPIQEIITVIKPYQEGHLKMLPEIKLKGVDPVDEMGQLATTLNSLSNKVQAHINALTHERNERASILESLIEGVIAIDEHGLITYANEMASKLLGLSANPILGQPLKGEDDNTLLHRRCVELLEMCQKNNETLTEMLELQNPDSGKSYLDLVATPLRNKGGAILVIQDKSSHYKLLAMRRDFIANASHELKTPITVIRGYAETLYEHQNLPKETYSKITQRIVRSCERMGALIQDLLALTDVEKLSDSRLIDCDLYSLTENCTHLFKEIFPDANISFQSDLAPSALIKADPSLLELAIMNLLENAGKYSKAPAQITIQLGQESSHLRLSVSDRGIGIPKADIPHIFERFYTVDKAHSRKMGGSGLGLSIVSTIIEKHHGSIAVDSELGQGTTFTIKLPV